MYQNEVRADHHQDLGPPSFASSHHSSSIRDSSGRRLPCNEAFRRSVKLSLQSKYVFTEYWDCQRVNVVAKDATCLFKGVCQTTVTVYVIVTNYSKFRIHRADSSEKLKFTTGHRNTSLLLNSKGLSYLVVSLCSRHICRPGTIKSTNMPTPKPDSASPSQQILLGSGGSWKMK